MLSGYEYGPPYRIPWQIALRAAAYIARGRQRSLAVDSPIALRTMPVAPMVVGADRIPTDGTVLFVANHYERPGLWMAWPALVLTVASHERRGDDVYWIAIREWESFSLYGIAIPRAVLRWVFERAFGVYGIVAMPPGNASAGERARAMRQAVARLRSGGVIGLMPEGTVGDTPELLPAREGAGSFVQLLASAGATVMPAGIYENEGRLIIRFGAPVDVSLPAYIARSARDDWTRNRIMTAIKELLPEPLWGEYRSAGLDP